MFGLSFLSPLFLVGAVAAAIPIALHLFFRRADAVVDFAAMRYLRTAPVEQASRRRLREWLLLALRCAAMMLLALAFARPYVAGTSALTSSARVVLLDTSLSLSAPGQFASARAKAEAAVRRGTPGELVGVIAFGATVDVAAPLSTDQAGALEAISSVKPGAGAARYRAALARAAEMIGDRAGQIVLVTDLQETGWDGGEEAGLPERIEVTVDLVAPPASNGAVTSLRVDGADAVAVVQNFAAAPQPYRVTFAVEGKPVGATPVTVAAGGSAEARVALGAHGAGELSASIDDRAGYERDNVRYAVLDARSVPSVLIVSTSGVPADAFFVQRAVDVGEGAGAFRLQHVSGQQLSSRSSDALKNVDAVVLLGTRGIEHQGRSALGEFVRGGGGLLVVAGPEVDPAVVKEALAGTASTSWNLRDPLRARSGDAAPLHFAPDDVRHPVFRPFGGVGALANVTFSQTVRMAVAPGGDVLARYSDNTAAVVEEPGGNGRVIFFASDLNNRWNDLPVQPTFVPFLHETLRYLAASRDGRLDYAVGDLPGSAGMEPGVMTLGGIPGRRVAVNADPRESDPAAMSLETFLSTVTRLNARAAQQATTVVSEREDSQRLWQYGLLLMVVGLALESMVGRRLG